MIAKIIRILNKMPYRQPLKKKIITFKQKINKFDQQVLFKQFCKSHDSNYKENPESSDPLI